ncbi:MAG: HAD family phosphatase [Clostridia bacterium]|nr:HAD family phosphatase [Clostridia bacterium]
MIKNIIFDMGGVLIDYNPEKTVKEHFSKEHGEIFLREILRNPVWNDKDRGIIFPEEIMERKKDVIPAEIFEKVSEMVHNFYPYMPPFEKMCSLNKTLKEKGYGIYLLSNASSDFHERRSMIPALEYFDGVVISADYKLLKPEKEIYETLLEKFSLNPGECFFIDDVQANIDGAEAAGISGHCYSHGDVDILKAELRKIGVEI